MDARWLGYWASEVHSLSQLLRRTEYAKENGIRESKDAHGQTQRGKASLKRDRE